ncbi:MAG: hypothetical protein ACTSQJ_03465 [Promethearchaeota archaeon]
MSIRLELIQKYPWLPSLEIFYSEVATLKPQAFISEVFSKYKGGKIQERIINFFTYALENLEQINEYKVDEINVHVYLILKILLYVLDNKILTNKIANLYSKVMYKELLYEDDAYLYDICQDLKLKIRFYQQPIQYGINITKESREILQTNFQIHYIDYLRLAAGLHDEYRKLVNNAISGGYVYLQKRSLIRLIQEFIRKKFDINEDKASLTFLKKELMEINEFKELYDNITTLWELKKEDFEYSFEISFKKGTDLSSSFPPCLKEILSKAREGQNLIHLERLFLVFFLHALDYPIKKIIDVFSTMPDFNREKTEYQVKFAKRKGYIPHSCETLKSLNLCAAKKYKDKICLEGYYSKKLDMQKKISHPLFYVQIKQYRSSKNKNKNKKNNQVKQNERK